MSSLFKRKRPAVVLGLALDGNRLDAVTLRRSAGGLHVRKSVSAPLTLSPLTDAPELVGQEIRNLLNQANLRERDCVVCVPLGWILSVQTAVPDLSEDDRASFLQLEGERSFHSGADSLLTASSYFKTPDGQQHATLLAAPRAQLETLQRVLRAAKLKPLAFNLGVTAVQPAKSEASRVVLVLVRHNTVDLQITAGDGIVALRSLDGAMEAQGAQRAISADLVAREIRITLGQLPGGLAQAQGKLKICGQGELVRQLVEDITPRAGVMGLKVEVMEKAASANFDQPLPPEIACSGALALAANYVRGLESGPSFLPPKIQPWRQLVTTRLSPRKIAWAGAAAGFLALCVAGAFGFQQWQIAGLEKKWRAMEPTVNELNADQDQIKKFRPWYDTSVRDLQILLKLKNAFPLDGSVSAKRVEIHDISGVTCTGIAKDTEAFARFHARLGDDTNHVSDLHAEVHGQKPMDFTLSFQWHGDTDGN